VTLFAPSILCGKSLKEPPILTTDDGIKQAPQDDIMTVRELAEFLHCHPSTIYRLLQQGKLPGFKVGSDWRFSREAIDRWRLAQLETRSGS